MKNQVTTSKTADSVTNNANLLGFYAAILKTVVTAVTSGIAILTPPLSGPFCVGSCFNYPFTKRLSDLYEPAKKIAQMVGVSLSLLL